MEQTVTVAGMRDTGIERGVGGARLTVDRIPDTRVVRDAGRTPVVGTVGLDDLEVGERAGVSAPGCANEDRDG